MTEPGALEALLAFAREVRFSLAPVRGTLAEVDRLVDRAYDVELLAASALGALEIRPSRIAVADLVAGLDGLEAIDGPGAALELMVDPGLFRRAVRDLWAAGLSGPVPRSIGLELAVVAPWVELRVVRDADAHGEPLGDDVTAGLALARTVAEAHGGALGLEQDGRRSVLWLRVPHA